MKIDLLKTLKSKIKEYQLQKLEEKENEKNHIASLLERKWSEEDIKSYNLNVIASTNGLLGGDYNEEDIKKSILRENCYLFSGDEEEELYNKINKNKIK